MTDELTKWLWRGLDAPSPQSERQMKKQGRKRDEVDVRLRSIEERIAAWTDEDKWSYEPDGWFISHAKQDIPWLVTQLRAAIAKATPAPQAAVKE